MIFISKVVLYLPEIRLWRSALLWQTPDLLPAPVDLGMIHIKMILEMILENSFRIPAEINSEHPSLFIQSDH